MEILKLNGMDLTCFPNMEAMRANADQLVKMQQECFPAMEQMHPNLIVDNFPLLDRFWYVDSKGTWVLF